MINFKEEIAGIIAGQVESLTEAEIADIIEIPQDSKMGDYAFPCFRLAKVLRKAPPLIAKDIASAIEESDLFDKVEPVNAYVNMFIAKEKLNNSQPLCEECAQETFLYLAKNFTKVGDLDSPRTRALVGVVASSCAIKIFHREFEKNTRIFIAAAEKYEPADFDSFSSLELKSAIDALDDELKNIIYMKFYLGFNNKEISSATGDSE